MLVAIEEPPFAIEEPPFVRRHLRRATLVAHIYQHFRKYRESMLFLDHIALQKQYLICLLMTINRQQQLTTYIFKYNLCRYKQANLSQNMVFEQCITRTAVLVKTILPSCISVGHQAAVMWQPIPSKFHAHIHIRHITHKYTHTNNLSQTHTTYLMHTHIHMHARSQTHTHTRTHARTLTHTHTRRLLNDLTYLFKQSHFTMHYCYACRVTQASK